MDRLRRGESVNEERDRRIEQRAIMLVRAGRDWLTAVVEATREIEGHGGAARALAGRGLRAGKATRTAAFAGAAGGLLARPSLATEPGPGADGERRDASAGADAERGPTLSQSLRAQLVALLGFDPARAPRTAEDRAAAAAGSFASGRDVEFAPGADVESDAPVRGLDKVKRAKTLAETLALLDDPEVPSEFARQAAVAHALLAADAGESLDGGVQRELGDRLDVALEDVRVHRDPVSSMIVEALGTRAFAFGRHLFFAPGTYAPGTDAGNALIAHELAHVAQQPQGDLRDARDIRNVRIGREGDAWETDADHAAGALVAGLRPQIQRGAPVAARMDGGGTVNPEAVLRKHIGHNEAKAKEALRNAGAKRGMVEGIIRDSFSKEDADRIIKETPAGKGGGAKAPAVEAKGGGAKAKGKADGKAGKGAQSKGDSQLKGGGKGGVGGKGGAKGGDNVSKVVDAFTGGELSEADRNLIATELAEHQAWSQAAAAVGAPGSMDRALFIAGQVGRGFAQGAATGAVMGVAMGVVGQLAQRFCPVPGVGAIIAGGMAAYGLATRDWGATRETISNFGEGASKWERIANSLAAISEILDLVVQVMNIVAGIIGLVSAIMWLITIITVGIASPLAGTLSAIALGILTVSGVIDNINNLVIQPAVIAFRAMHVMNSDADPREIVGQGAKLADSASKVGSAVGGYLAGRAVDAGGKAFDRRRYGPGGKPGARPAKPSSAQANATPDAPASRPAAGAPDAAAPRPSAGTPDAPAPRPSAGTPDAPAPHAQPGGAPDANAPAQPQRPAGMSEAEWRQRQEHAQRTWGEKMRFAREKITGHNREYAARAREEQQRLADAEDAAFHAKQQEIDAARQRAHAEADAAHQQAVDEGRVSADEAAAQTRQRRVEQTNEEHAAAQASAKERFGNDLKRNAQRYLDAQRDAARMRDDQHAQIRRERADVESRHREAMADAAKIDDAAARARAEASANQRKQWDLESLDRRARSADSDYQRAKDRARQDYDRGWTQAMKDVDQRRQWRDDAKERGMKRAEWESDLARQRAERQSRNAADDARDRARGTADREHGAASAKEPDAAARAARAREEGGPDTGESLGDYWSPNRNPLRTLAKPWQTLGRSVRDNWQMGREHSTREGGARSAEWGDYSSKQLDPGFSPGGGPVRGVVEDATKKAFGLDKSTEEERNEADEAQKREYGGDSWYSPFTSAPGRIWDEAITGEKKSETQVAAQKAEDAQFLKDHAKNENGERKNPHYTPPPAGSLKELDTIKQNWEKALEKQHEAEAAAKVMQQEKAKHQANEAPIDGLHGEAKKAIENTGAHKADVKAKADANVKQTQKQAEAAQKIDDFASQQSKFDAVITPMRGLERFTHIGAAVGVSYFDDMNKEIKKTLGGLEDASAAMKKEQAQQPAAKAELKAKAETISQTDAKAAATDSSFKESEKGVTQLKQDNTDAVAKAGAAEAQAQGQKSQYAAKVAQYQQQYTTMAGGLLSWARQHQAERTGQPAIVEVQDGGPQTEEDADGADGGGGGGGDAPDAAPNAPPAGAPAPGAPAPHPAGANAGAPPAPAGAPAPNAAPDAGAPPAAAAPPPAAAPDAGTPPPAAPPPPPPQAPPAKQP